MHAQALGAHAGEPLFLLVVCRQAARDHRVAGLSQPPADRRADAPHSPGDECDALDDRPRAVAPELLVYQRLIDDFAFFAHGHSFL